CSSRARRRGSRAAPSSSRCSPPAEPLAGPRRSRYIRAMIPRYSRPEMVRLWTPEHRYQTWLQVELAAARAMAEAGIVPPEAVEECARTAGSFTAQDAARID